MRVLLVEDDELLGDAIKTGLIQFGYTVDWLKEGSGVRSSLQLETFDIVLLDWGLPKASGLSILQDIRNQKIHIPVIMLTAREAVEDRVKGLDCGADDYLIKPFDLHELGARIRALTRRTQGRSLPVLHYNNITLDPASHTVYVDESPVNVPRREFALLQKLLENQGTVLSRESLMQSIYGWEEDIDSNALEVHIHNLRKKLNAYFIRTIRGIGYIIEKK